MAKKNKKTTLFNKNHITIIKEEHPYNDSNYATTRTVIADDYTQKRNYWDKDNYEDVKCVSKLGFYYTKRIYKPKVSKSSVRETRVIDIYLNNKNYTITYTLRANGNSIDKDLRPWEVNENEKAMQEHFITALKNLIDNIIDELLENKTKVVKYNYWYKGDNESIKYLKDLLYKELFGSVKGIMFQTDSEKIIAHGFDLKTSFRKGKSNEA